MIFTLAVFLAGAVAPITESEPGVLSEELQTTPLVDQDSATRRARRLAVQSDVGKLGFFTQEAFVAEKPFQRLIFFGS